MISKQGNRHLRWLLVASATAFIRYARSRPARPNLGKRWPSRLVATAAEKCLGRNRIIVVPQHDFGCPSGSRDERRKICSAAPLMPIRSLALHSNLFQLSFPLLRGHIASAQRRWSASRPPIVVVIAVTGFAAKDGAPVLMPAPPRVISYPSFSSSLDGRKVQKVRKGV
jgi:hypothetical protein